MTTKIILRDFKTNRHIYLMLVPVVIFFIIFHYLPMYGVIIAFKDFSPMKGIVKSPWLGFVHFKSFFQSYYFFRLIRNTLLISVYSIIFGFPAPILFALLLNELKVTSLKRSIQTVTYLPHFVSMVVICGLIRNFFESDGLISDIIVFLGGERSNLIGRPDVFRAIYVGTGIWQEVGWGSIIYLAALANINPELYQASEIDGAGRLSQAWHISLPSITPTIVILLILRLGFVMTVGFEKVLLLYGPLTMETADVIATYVYRRGLQQAEYSYAASIGLLNSVINFTLLVCSNWISRKFSETSLW